MNEDAHAELRNLIPWYITGALDAAEQARVGSHVAGCAECQAEVEVERNLRAAVGRLAMPVENGWAEMRRRLDAETAVATPRRTTAPPWMGWSIAATLALTTGVIGYGVAPRGEAPEAAYRALGAAPRPEEAGNVIVILRPDLREDQLRALLTANHARVTDGPTAAGAYVLRVAPADRTAILARLQANPGVVLAQPIDATP